MLRYLCFDDLHSCPIQFADHTLRTPTAQLWNLISTTIIRSPQEFGAHWPRLPDFQYFCAQSFWWSCQHLCLVIHWFGSEKTHENPMKPLYLIRKKDEKHWKTWIHHRCSPLISVFFFPFSVQDKSRRAQLERLQRQQERLEDLNTCGFQRYRNLKFGIYFYILLHTSTV